jgi:hypothetical protein
LNRPSLDSDSFFLLGGQVETTETRDHKLHGRPCEIVTLTGGANLRVESRDLHVGKRSRQMKFSFTSLITAACLSGLMTGTLAAQSQPAKQQSKDQKSASKNSASQSAGSKSASKDKNSCGGKNGCGNKK